VAALATLGVTSPRIGLFGINPHAGEGGLFGDDDERINVPAAARLRAAGASLLDTQFVTPHLATLGAVEIPRDEYHRRLDEALGRAADFYVWPKDERVSGAQALQALAQSATQRN
jgi:hypothetical protein